MKNHETRCSGFTSLSPIMSSVSSIAMLCRRLLPLHHPCGSRGLCGVVPDTVLSPQRRAEFIDRVSRQKLRLPAGDGSAPGAAVLAPLCRLHGTPGLLFTLRSSALNKHAGQVSFPGGKRDDEDEDLLATALRETWEELGLRVEREQVWTQLPAMLSHRLGRKPVATFVADVGEVEIDRLRPEPTEVEDVFILSLDHLCRPENYGQTQWRLANSPGYVMPAYINGPHRVWGFTAIMTHVLLHNLLPEVYSHKVRMIKPVPVDG
ncbi:MAG: CoA pyrophosphatase [Pseudomonadota bacterium]